MGIEAQPQPGVEATTARKNHRLRQSDPVLRVDDQVCLRRSHVMFDHGAHIAILGHWNGRSTNGAEPVADEHFGA